MYSIRSKFISPRKVQFWFHMFEWSLRHGHNNNEIFPTTMEEQSFHKTIKGKGQHQAQGWGNPALWYCLETVPTENGPRGNASDQNTSYLFVLD